MGAFKRIISTIFRRPTRNWNVENRAQKLIDKQDKGQKPAPAPKHPTSVQHIETMKNEQTGVMEELKKKNPSLDSMLKGMVVNPDRVGEVRSKTHPLPEDRSKVTDQEFGYLEPSVITPGRCTIKQSLEFIVAHQTDPKTHSSTAIAEQYKLDKAQVQQVLKYFQTLQLKMPKKSAASDLLEEAKSAQAHFIKSGKNIKDNTDSFSKAGS